MTNRQTALKKGDWVLVKVGQADQRERRIFLYKLENYIVCVNKRHEHLYTLGKEYDTSHWYERKEIEEPQDEFVIGEKVLVKNNYDNDREERIYITTIEGANRSAYIAVAYGDEEAFHNGGNYSYYGRDQIKKLPVVEEMTLAQVCEELGREIKIIE